jgi:hypothetical protein
MEQQCLGLKILKKNEHCRGSGMFIPDPDFLPSRIPALGIQIPDPTTIKKRRGTKLVVLPISIFIALNSKSLKLFLKRVHNNLSQLTKNLSNFKPKVLLSFQKYGFWDPGSGKNIYIRYILY